jgi:hypothetical protein
VTRCLPASPATHGVTSSSDHAASSCGQPVLVLDDGRALGPGDIAAQDIIELSAEELHWIVSAESALCHV